MSSSHPSQTYLSLASSLDLEDELTKLTSPHEISSSQPGRKDLKLASSLDPEGELTKLISNGQLRGHASAQLMSHFKHVIEWFKRPDIRNMLLASGLTFGAVLLVIMNLGFGSIGIVGGSIAAVIQSGFGAFTPAGSLFTLLQSMGMTGTLLPTAIGVAGGAAALVAGCFHWFSGGKRQGREDHQHKL